MTVELLNDAGEVIDSTVTDRSGSYRFGSFAETGDYQIRVAESNSVVAVSSQTLDVLISNGSTRLRGLNFTVSTVA